MKDNHSKFGENFSLIGPFYEWGLSLTPLGPHIEKVRGLIGQRDYNTLIGANLCVQLRFRSRSCPTTRKWPSSLFYPSSKEGKIKGTDIKSNVPIYHLI